MTINDYYLAAQNLLKHNQAKNPKDAARSVVRDAVYNGMISKSNWRFLIREILNKFNTAE
jgi:hypothetical protein